MKDEKEAKKVGLGKNIAMKRKDIVKRWNCLYYKMNLRWGNNVYTTGPYIQRFRKNPSSSGWMKWSSMRIWLSAAASNWPENMYSI